MKRKHLVVATSLILASFLLGSALAAGPGNPLVALWNAVFGLQDDVVDLQAQIDALEAQMPVGLNPDYDSGWVWLLEGPPTFPLELPFTHNLNTRDLFVYFYFEMEDMFLPPHDYKATHNILEADVWWQTTSEDAINLYIPRWEYPWQYVRVLIWEIQD